MLSARRLLLPFAFAALALTAVSCGVDAGDQASTATTAPSSSDGSTTAPDTTEPDTTTPDTTAPKDLDPQQQAALEAMISTYESMGLEKKDAECLANGMIGMMEDGSSPSSTPDVMDVINDCDISMDVLSELGQNAGGDSLEDGMRYGLESSFKTAGLSDEQASCMADAFIEEYGTDASAANDPAKVEAIMSSCGVKPSDLDGN